jgi:hypothetical protein
MKTLDVDVKYESSYLGEVPKAEGADLITERQTTMPHDEPYLAAEKQPANNHPRIKPTTNSRMSVHIRVFVALFVDGFSLPKGG